MTAPNTRRTDAALAAAEQVRLIFDEIEEQTKTPAPSPAPSVGGSLLGAVELDSFRSSHNDWDDALDRALAHIAEARRTAKITPPLLFPTAEIDLQRGGRAWGDGVKFIYPFGHGNQQRAAESIPCSVRFHGKGPLWRFAQSNVFDIGFEGIGWQGNAEADFIEASKTNVWSANFGSAGFNLWRHVMGNPSQQFLSTASLWHGWWNTNNCYNSPYTFGGSDSSYAWGRHIVDVGGSPTASRFPKGGYLLNFAYSSHNPVTGLYLTCENDVVGVKTSNSDSGGRIVLRDPIIEGRNPGRPCTGTLLQVDSGIVIVENPVLEFVKKDDDFGAGVVINGGDVEILRPTFDRANGVAPRTPVIYQLGGELNVVRAKRTSRGGSWGDQLPVVRSAGGKLAELDGTMVED